MDYHVNKGEFLEMSVTFLGATNGIVTGSSSMVTIRRRDVVKNILVDFGSYQGEHEEMNLNRVLPVPADEIDYVIVTHSHADHIGSVPVLFKEGYLGDVYGSAETLNQGSEILRDCAILNSQRMRFRLCEIKKMEKLLERELSRAKRKDVSRKEIASILSSQEDVAEERAMVPYLLDDAEKAIQHFIPIPINQEFSLCEGIYVKLIPNSHINGATLVEIYATHGAERCSIAFSGDIGRDNHPLYKEIVYEEEPDIDFLVLESLHGTSKETENYEDSYKAMYKVIRKAVRENKKVYVVFFALDRSALVLGMINEMRRSGLKFPCVFDTPLGEKELYWYTRAYKSENSEWFDYDKPYPFDVEHIRFARDHEEHMLFVKRDGPFVALTSSGMGYGGRVVDYFYHHIQDKDAIFIFPEFLPEECPSKILCDAAKGDLVEIHDNVYVKHCTTVQLNGCSGHGYRKEKLKIINRYSNTKVIFLNHGDAPSIQDMYDTLPEYTNAKIVVPGHKDTYDLTQILREK